MCCIGSVPIVEHPSSMGRGGCKKKPLYHHHYYYSFNQIYHHCCYNHFAILMFREDRQEHTRNHITLGHKVINLILGEISEP